METTNIRLEDDYMPIIYKLPAVTNKIINVPLDPMFRSSIPYPASNLGFQHFIHQSKEKMTIVNKFKGKKKVYEVYSKFEQNVDDYDNDLAKTSLVYFNIGPKPNILSRAFYKLWEMLFAFNLANDEKFVSAHLAEGPGSFIQATMFFRDKFYPKLSKKDKYHAITLHSEDTQVPPIHTEFINYYEKEKEQRFFLHKTYEKKMASKEKDNGDLTNLNTINNFAKKFEKEKAILVTADGGFEWVSETLQEQEAFKLILGQVITALRIQKKGGNFICKIYETYTKLYIKLIACLQELYTNVYIMKPFTSRKSNSEKYIICINFLDSNTDTFITNLSKLLSDITNKEPSLFINDFFPSFAIGKEVIEMFIHMNVYLANRQFQAINEMIDFINKENYRGDDYQTRREMQIKASIYWISTFYCDADTAPNAINDFTSFVNTVCNMNGNAIKKLSAKLTI